MSLGNPRRRATLAAAALALAAVPAALATSATADPAPSRTVPAAQPVAAAANPATRAAQRPRWERQRVFGKKKFLVAYYGTAGTGVLGVLGETSVEEAHERLVAEGRRFVRKGERLVPVYELIVTVADAVPGTDGDYSHDISHAAVEEYVDAAREQGALVVLDVQPGRSDFLTVAKRWQWALEQPHVGLALDPEWRMGPEQVPGQVIGSVGAREVNAVSRWLSELTVAADLPEKPFVVHQFRSSMLTGIGRVKRRDGLALVQHVDGFGSPAAKIATYSAVARPKKFTMGFKLFYDEDSPRMRAKAVRRDLPQVRFVSFQ